MLIIPSSRIISTTHLTWFKLVLGLVILVIPSTSWYYGDLSERTAANRHTFIYIYIWYMYVLHLHKLIQIHTYMIIYVCQYSYTYTDLYICTPVASHTTSPQKLGLVIQWFIRYFLQKYMMWKYCIFCCTDIFMVSFCSFSPRKLGKSPILTYIFSDGLKLPTSCWYLCTKLYVDLEPFDDPCFDWKQVLFWGGLTFKSRGHLGSRYTYIQIYIYRERERGIHVRMCVIGIDCETCTYAQSLSKQQWGDSGFSCFFCFALDLFTFLWHPYELYTGCQVYLFVSLSCACGKGILSLFAYAWSAGRHLLSFAYANDTKHWRWWNPIMSQCMSLLRRSMQDIWSVIAERWFGSWVASPQLGRSWHNSRLDTFEHAFNQQDRGLPFLLFKMRKPQEDKEFEYPHAKVVACKTSTMKPFKRRGKPAARRQRRKPFERGPERQRRLCLHAIELLCIELCTAWAWLHLRQQALGGKLLPAMHWNDLARHRGLANVRHPSEAWFLMVSQKLVVGVVGAQA